MVFHQRPFGATLAPALLADTPPGTGVPGETLRAFGFSVTLRPFDGRMMARPEGAGADAGKLADNGCATGCSSCVAGVGAAVAGGVGLGPIVETLGVPVVDVMLDEAGPFEDDGEKAGGAPSGVVVPTGERVFTTVVASELDALLAGGVITPAAEVLDTAALPAASDAEVRLQPARVDAARTSAATAAEWAARIDGWFGDAMTVLSSVGFAMGAARKCNRFQRWRQWMCPSVLVRAPTHCGAGDSPKDAWHMHCLLHAAPASCSANT